MADDTSKLKDFDNFFYYGLGNLNDEIKSDMLQLMLQPKRSLFYSRDRNSAGVPGYENWPGTVNMEIAMRYDIVRAIGQRNLDVSRNNPDRRVAASQSEIVITQTRGEANVNIPYIPLKDFRQSDTITIPFGAGG